MKPLLSIVIPAYNAVSTVERTVRSVLASTLPIDLWIVNDGSTDGTGELLDRLVELTQLENGSCIHIIHQTNCGAYQARLNALKQISTPYFGFVDADDTVNPMMFEKMIAFAERENLDVVQCGYEEDVRVVNAEGGMVVLGDRDEVYHTYIYPKLLNIKEASFIWDKIYRNQYDFATFDETDHVTNFDDMIFNLQFFLPVKKMGFLREALYKYSTTTGSAVHSFNEKKIRDFREAWRVREAFVPKYGIPANDPIMDAWTLLNARSAIITAATATNLKSSEQTRLVKKMAMLPEVGEALHRRGVYGWTGLIVAMSRCFSGSFVASLLRIVWNLKG